MAALQRIRPYLPKNVLTLNREGVHPLLAKVLASREVEHESEIFGRLGQLLHHSGLKGAREAAKFLADCIQVGRHIVVVADYDCDGATACATAVRGLSAMGAKVDYIVPDRFVHGYGLTPGVVDLAIATFPSAAVIVTVDNGVASHAGVEHAVTLGLEVVVTDHHLPSKLRALPPARVVVDHQQDGCLFESKALAGVGVIWYVLWALQDEFRSRGNDLGGYKVSALLPLVAVGTVADVVPLDKNNRILIEAGLKKIRSGDAFCGLLALAKAGKFNKTDPAELVTTDIAFGLGPRINAAGRLLNMKIGIDCLLEENPEKARVMADDLDAVNQERKNVEHGIVVQAFEEAEALVEEGTKSIVVCRKGWHHGVIGIVAGRIKERRWRPTFVLAEEESGALRGSGRSIPGFNLKDALDQVDKAHPGLMPKFGGHAMAAGVTIRAGGFEDFKSAFEAEAQRLLTDELLLQVLEHDGSLSGMDLCPATARILDTPPWGQMFPAPSFCDIFNVISAKVAGVHKDQLNMTLERQGVTLQATKFRHEGEIPEGVVHIIYKLSRGYDKFGNDKLKLLIDHVL